MAAKSLVGNLSIFLDRFRVRVNHANGLTGRTCTEPEIFQSNIKQDTKKPGFVAYTQYKGVSYPEHRKYHCVLQSLFDEIVV